MADVALKPCRWCHTINPLTHSFYGGKEWEISCRACGVHSPPRTTEAEAIATWNARPADELRELAKKVAEARESGTVGTTWAFNAALDALADYFREHPND